MNNWVGVSNGAVFHIPSSNAVIKVFATRDKFDRELAVYRRLSVHDATQVQQFSIPRLLDSNPDALVLKMSFVRPPFLLDFVQATLDSPQDFSQEVTTDWWNRVADNFGEERFAVAQSVFYELIQRFGIYYYDLKVGNLSFE